MGFYQKPHRTPWQAIRIGYQVHQVHHVHHCFTYAGGYHFVGQNLGFGMLFVEWQRFYRKASALQFFKWGQYAH